MSSKAKWSLAGAVGVAVSIIGYVHLKQEWEREKLHAGVIKDIERQRLKKLQKEIAQNSFNDGTGI